MTVSIVSRLCSTGMHSFCQLNTATCACTECHFICPRCDENVRLLYQHRAYDEKVCVTCFRELAKKTPFRGTPCDKCGKLGAVRNPRHRRNEYLCIQCHQESGESLQIAGGASGVLAECASKPLEDRSHEFLKVRSTRFRCSRCMQDYFGSGNKINVVGEVKGWH